MNIISMKKEFGTGFSLIPEVLDFTKDFLDKAGLNNLTHDIQMVVEEWYVNIVKYAYGEREEGLVRIELTFVERILEIVIVDNGPEFDPHIIPTPERPKDVQSAKIGGLGIFFIRSLMDTTEYHRKNDQNIFRMRKKIPR